MGAAASITQLPEKLNEEIARSVCGANFDQILFDAAKDGDGVVDRDQFLKNYAEESEIRRVFAAYSPQGSLDSRTYIKLCRDMKFLNKKFSSGEADLIFSKVSHAHPQINYSIFRHQILVDIASKKEVGVDKLLQKLATSEGPVLHATTAEKVRFHDDQSTFTGTHTENKNHFKNDIQAAGPSEHNAALKVQNVQRTKIAQKQVKELKEVK